MPLPDRVVEAIRRNTKRAFAVVPGVQPVEYESINSDKNLYHDETSTAYAAAVSTFGFIEFDAPMKVVKELGWWREGETSPILMYMPWEDDITPKQGDRFTTPATEGYFGATWRVNHVKMYGQGKPLVWYLNVSPERKD